MGAVFLVTEIILNITLGLDV